jgi:hypothetical protein
MSNEPIEQFTCSNCHLSTAWVAQANGNVLCDSCAHVLLFTLIIRDCGAPPKVAKAAAEEIVEAMNYIAARRRYTNGQASTKMH